MDSLLNVYRRVIKITANTVYFLINNRFALRAGFNARWQGMLDQWVWECCDLLRPEAPGEEC